MPFFSIIIPTFNSAKTLDVALKSILQQTYTDFEILLMDGLSTDNTLEIAKSYNDQRIIISSEKDEGIYDAMNKGIKLARGEWLFFLGSDDLLYDKHVLGQIFKAREYHFNIIYGNVLIEGNAGWAKNGQVYDGEFSLQKIIERNICHQAIFYKKAVFEKCGVFNINYNVCADWDLNLRLWSTRSFYYIDLIVSIFNGGNTSFLIANNYGETDKWISIISSFKHKIIYKEFSKFQTHFLTLSKYYFKKNRYFNSTLLLLVYFIHKMRTYL